LDVHSGVRDIEDVGETDSRESALAGDERGRVFEAYVD
jgi:hypothetical protein